MTVEKTKSSPTFALDLNKPRRPFPTSSTPKNFLDPQQPATPGQSSSSSSASTGTGCSFSSVPTSFASQPSQPAQPAAQPAQPQLQPVRSNKSTQPSDETVRLASLLVGERGFETSRYGVTSATARAQPVGGVGPPHSSRPPFFPPARPTVSEPARIDFAASVRTASARGKRSLDDGNFDGAFRVPYKKKPRLGPPGSLNLDGIVPRTAEELVPGGATSPLFFSNTAKHMTGRPPSFSTSEPAAAMLGSLRDDKDAFTTVKLPKGQVVSASPQRRNNITPNSVDSMDSILSRPSRSPDSRSMPPQLMDLQGVGVIELLEHDERPTFIIDLKEPANFGPGQLHLLFANASLRASSRIYGLISESSEQNSNFSRFKAWVVSFVKQSRSMDVCLPSLSYGGISWTCSTIRNRYRFVSGNSAAVSITPTSPSPLAQTSSVLDQRARGPTPSREPHTPGRDRSVSDADYFGETTAEDRIPDVFDRRARSEPRDLSHLPDTTMLPNDNISPIGIPELEVVKASFDWTRILTDSMSSHLKFARSVEWEHTPLGSIDYWPADLRTMSNLIMGSPHPAAMYWGPEFIAIYNEAYIEMAGKKHPQLMGMSYTDAWAEIWDALKPTFDAAWNHGHATMKHDDRLFLVRNGFIEETFFNWSIVPLVGGDGSVVALYNPAFENTKRKVNERRMLTLREIGERTSLARDVKSFWMQVRKGLEYNEYDIPFALVYSVSEDSESEVSSMHSGSVVNPPIIALEGSLGVPAGHRCAVPEIDLRTPAEGFGLYMKESMVHQGVPIVLTKEAGTLPQDLIDGLDWRGFGDPSRTVVVFPVFPTTGGESVVGFIVMGCNPRRPYNDDYQLFVHLLSRQLATSMASVVLFEEEIKRGQRAARLAALDRQELSLQLRLRTQEAVESEYKFTRMAEFAPVGIFIADSRGLINFCNDSWWEISRHPRTLNTINTWQESVRDEDRPAVQAAWKKLITDKVSITHEFRFKTSREANGHPIDTCVLMSAYPEKDVNGEIKTIFGSLTDISQQKWAEIFQKQRKEEAVELKRQQENFIDITSHEMRNPLSAILQCADEITNSVSSYGKNDPSTYIPGKLNALLEGCLEASSTISLCASHQKRIVDDILTLSKLDSQLLYVTPVDCQPVAVIESVMKMFEQELNSNNIRGEFRIDPSYHEMGIDWAKLDPSRLRQVLINLMTNSIKFTQNCETRSIVITLGASLDISETREHLEYFVRDKEDKVDLLDKPGWGHGEEFNLHLSVSDTGPGLDEQEMAMLFQRFLQASPRTHVQYGGSGLGLFISRTLTELQGGQIGVLSEKGVGSTFAFYIKGRKVELPHLSPTTVVHPPFSPTRQNQTVQYTTQRSRSQRVSPKQSDSPPAASPPPVDPSVPPPPPPIDVLIVEDNLVNQKVLNRQLCREGYNTYLANHGGEAIEALQRSGFWNHEEAAVPAPGRPRAGSASSGNASEKKPLNISVVLMDLEMPVMDGLTCARKIRELEAQGVLKSHVPIIAVTAYARPEQIANAKAMGMDDVISKPFRMPELIPKITELVEQYSTRAKAPKAAGNTD